MHENQNLEQKHEHKRRPNDNQTKKAFESLNKTPVKIYALGGLGEVGKNVYCIEDDKAIIMIDCGVLFPDDSLPGVNYIIPDFSYLQQNHRKVKAMFITHGHEDHIGSIPFFLQLMDIPAIYAPKLALSLINHKIEDFKLKPSTPIIEYNEESSYKIGNFTIEFFRVTHSIPDCYGIVVKTPQGTIVTSGDFKIDLTPIDNQFNFSKLVRYGDEGIDLLMADSTNAEREGYTPSETSVINSILTAFNKAKGRIIISTFASNISRIAQIIDATLQMDRKLVIMGRSMESNVKSAREFGYIKIPNSSLISLEQSERLPKNKIVILCTGSQGENLAALSRIANGDHKSVHIMPGDSVVFSSNPIPGNTQSVNTLINLLVRQGAEVYVNDGSYNLHASGHPSRQELKLLQRLARPKYFMPVHGDYRMLKLHAELAQELGMPEENTFVVSNGDVLTLFNHKVSYNNEHVHADALYIDGQDAVGLSTSIIRDRNILSNEGAVAIYIVVDTKNNKLVGKPEIESRGFMDLSKSYIRYKLSDIVFHAINKQFTSSHVTYQGLKDTIKQEVGRYLYRETKRSPMVIPLILTYNANVQTDSLSLRKVYNKTK